MRCYKYALSWFTNQSHFVSAMKYEFRLRGRWLKYVLKLVANWWYVYDELKNNSFSVGALCWIIASFTSRFLTSEPHIAGSTRQKELAVYLAEKWRKYGFDEVEMPEYEVRLSLPEEDKPNKVEIVNNGTVEHTIMGKIQVWLSALRKILKLSYKGVSLTWFFSHLPNPGHFCWILHDKVWKLWSLK